MLQHNEFEKNPFREGGNCKKITLQSDFCGKMSLCRGKKLRESPLGRENDAAMTIL